MRFLPFPDKERLEVQVLADRYVASPSAKKEEEMLKLMDDIIGKRVRTFAMLFSITDVEDLEITGDLGCIKAMRSYNKEKGHFYGWCNLCVYRALNDALKTEGVLFRVPRSLRGIIQIEYISFGDVDNFLEGLNPGLCRTEQDRQELRKMLTQDE